MVCIMSKSPFLLTLAALAFGLTTEAEAQLLTDDDLLRCQELLEELQPGQLEDWEQDRCLALLAQLGVQPARFDLTDPIDPH